MEVLAQVVLTPSESKKLIAMAVAELDMVKKAPTIILHPSSSTYFIVEAITGEKPKTDIWIAGAILPKGLCNDLSIRTRRHIITRNGKAMSGPAWFAESWVIRDNKVTVGTPLVDLLEEIGPDDIYIKGVNAVDPQGNVGVLVGNDIEGGTIGLIIAKREQKGFNFIFPVGLEKLVPGPIPEMAKETKDRSRYIYGMGIPSYLLACPPTGTVTEVKAIEVLSGATAIPMAAGGLNGAEGSVVLLIKGDEDKVKNAIRYVEMAKGAQVPQVRVANCYDCPSHVCKFPVASKPWVKW